MICAVLQLVDRLSAVLPLLPGDVIFTGTPAGVGLGRDPQRWLAPGDVAAAREDDRMSVRMTFAI